MRASQENDPDHKVAESLGLPSGTDGRWVVLINADGNSGVPALKQVQLPFIQEDGDAVTHMYRFLRLYNLFHIKDDIQKNTFTNV